MIIYEEGFFIRVIAGYVKVSMDLTLPDLELYNSRYNLKT
jgi:hypothetical protein